MKLDFPTLDCPEKSAPVDLMLFAYEDGPRLSRHKLVWGADYKSMVGPLVSDRLPLLKLIHADFLDNIESGDWKKKTVETYFKHLKKIYIFSESAHKNLNASNLETIFFEWQESVLDHMEEGKVYSAHENSVNALASIIGRILGKPSNVLKVPRNRKSKRHGFPTSKNSKILDSTVFEFGRNLFDIKNSLNADAIFSKLPVKISLRSGVYFEHWARMVRPENVKAITDPKNTDPWHVKNTIALRAEAVHRQSIWDRGPLLNLRLQTEMMIFISQTSVPPSSAYEMERFIFKTGDRVDGTINVECWKNRLKDEISFTIFEEYWPLFQEYLKFRDEHFPDNTELFPFSGKEGIKRNAFVPVALKNLLMELGRPYTSPTALKKHRVNFFARTTDVRTTLAVGQHTLGTFVKNYNEPNLNTSIQEWAAFFLDDLSRRKNLLDGLCSENTPKSIPSDSYDLEPDCRTPAGCLGCDKFRGVDELDFIWSLLSYRYLKELETANSPIIFSTNQNMLRFEISRIDAYANEFKSRSLENLALYNIASNRIDEECFLPKWEGYIALYGLIK